MIMPPQLAPIADNHGIVSPEWLRWLLDLAQASPLRGSGSPEGMVQAPVGSLYLSDSAPVLWVKEGGAESASGWVSK